MMFSRLKHWASGVAQGLGLGKSQATEDRAEIIQQIEAGDAMKAMTELPAFKRFEQSLAERFVTLQAALRKAGAMKEVIKLQAQLDELEFVLRVVPEFVETGRSARARLEQIVIEEEMADE